MASKKVTAKDANGAKEGKEQEKIETTKKSKAAKTTGTTKKEGTKKTGTKKRATATATSRTKTTKAKGKIEEESKKEKAQETKQVEKKTTKSAKSTATRKTTKSDKNQKEKVQKQEEKAVEPKTEKIEIEKIQKTIEEKKIVPKEEIEKINSHLFRNIMIALAVIVYFIFLNLGQMNIQTDVYTTDLKVFSMCILLTAIVLIEVAYQKESGEIALYGIEMIVLSLVTVALIYVNLMASTRFAYIASAISYIFGAYYVIKALIIYIKKRRKYFVDDMKEMMNKDE